MKRTLQIFVLFALFAVGIGFFSRPTYAVTGSDFKPGRIIDDVIFTNKASMTIAQIQQFLDSKVAGGSCDTDGTRPSTRWNAGAGRYYTHAEWGAANGNPAPFVCLTTYRENSTTKQTNLGNPNLVIAGSQSAAEIIYNAGQQYNINPQVLIVLLQKEQSLITDDWPWATQYSSATGAYCPDTAPCDASQAGFGTQVREAARLFRYYMNTPFLYFIGNNYVRYNPNSACGGTNVYIENFATEALYHYTPYQPNQSALNNLYGTGDSCGAYGNRNFWRMFNDWFGATLTTAYEYNYVSSTPSVVGFEPQQTYTASVSLRNMGSAVWYADGAVPVGQHPTRLASKGYENIPYADSTDPAWLGTKNQVKMTPAIVNPGEVATFTYRLKGPLQLLAHRTYSWIPVIDGMTFMRDLQLQFIAFTYAPPFVNTTPSTFTTVDTIMPNQSTTKTITLRNSGLAPWYADGAVPVGQHPMRLAIKGYENTSYADSTDPAWLGTKNQVKMTPAIVNPGEVATFTFKLRGPFTATNQKLYFIPVQDGVTFLNDPQISLELSTPAPTIGYQYVSSVSPPAIMSPGSVAQASITIKNTGNVVWQNETYRSADFARLRLVTVQPLWRNSAFTDTTGSWLTTNQISYGGTAVAPGNNATITFNWKAPALPGTYSEPITPILDGLGTMADSGMLFITKVQ